MVDENQIITLTVNQQNKASLVKQGIITQDIQYGEVVHVPLHKFSARGNMLAEVQCDYCGDVRQMPIGHIRALRGNTYCCPKCIKRYKKTRNAQGELTYVYAPYRDKDWLYQEYIVKGRSAEDIGKECGLGQRTLRDWISKYGLTEKKGAISAGLPVDEIKYLYTHDKLGSNAIGARYGVTGNTIVALLRNNGVYIPSTSEWSKIYMHEKGGVEHLRRLATPQSRIKTSCRQRGIAIEDFDGFTHSEHALIRTSSVYSEWRKAVFERDNYTCQKCGVRGGQLHAHHIENFSSREDLRMEVSNGITLCERCHSVKYPNSFHAIYGEYNNNLEQLKEFLQRDNCP